MRLLVMVYVEMVRRKHRNTGFRSRAECFFVDGKNEVYSRFYFIDSGPLQISQKVLKQKQRRKWEAAVQSFLLGIS